MLSPQQIAARAAREVEDAQGVRLGPGLPESVVQRLQGLARGEEPEVVFVHAEQVTAQGEVVIADEGAIELARRAQRVVVVMAHVTEDGAPRIVERRAHTERTAVANRILTELAVIDVTAEGLRLRELAPKVSAREVQQRTEPTLLAGPDLAPIEL